MKSYKSDLRIQIIHNHLILMNKQVLGSFYQPTGIRIHNISKN